MTPEALRRCEDGETAPSLPELEFLVYFLGLPLARLWGNETVTESPAAEATLDLRRLRGLRQRVIGATLRQEREAANLTPGQLAQEMGMPTERLQAYELGEIPIPVPELEALLAAVNSRLERLFDKNGPVGKWIASQEATGRFQELPEEMQAFVGLPVNRPYLELAMKLSVMSKERLRAVAEGLLDITL
jgi:transcriptional regulator with XRE-family HTH domain